MDHQQLLITVDKIIENPSIISSLPSGKEYNLMQHILQKRNFADLSQHMAEEAKQRLLKKGYVRAGNLGWFKRKELEIASIEFKYQKWVITNRDKYRNYLKEKFEEKQKFQAEEEEKQQSLLTL